MLTRERVAALAHDPLQLFRDLGYPIAPVDVDPTEWRRGGVQIPWNGHCRLRLAARLRNFDLFHLEGDVPQESIAEFLHSYREYNLLTKSAVLSNASLFDLGPDRRLRRLDLTPTPHAVDRLNLLACGVDLPRIFDRALDRESVTRLFFQRFRNAVGDVAAALAESTGESKEAVGGEALLILSRLLFLSFVQEKGWLDGERRFLVDRLAHEIRRGREFFTSVLVPLFFGCLNTPVGERKLAARRLGSIPYLNGGLFEPSAFERRHPRLSLPNELLQRVIEEVFERFDFRIDETDAAGTHVDPEMLGKVFESLMAAEERLSSGSFYTPREIVDALTERAVSEWLGDGGVERLERITVLDPACGSGAFLLSALGTIERHYKRLLGDRVPADLRQRIVSRNLFGVDLKPEAVRLCELRLWLAIVAATNTPAELVQPLPNLDRNILQGNSLLSPTDFLGDARADLYAEWMVALHAQRDLLERYRSASHAQRPALYRVIRGNDQRLAAELLSKAIESAERELQRLAAPQRDLFGRAIPSDVDACRTLQKRIAETRARLERVEEGTLDFFSFDIHFAHVMARGGFQVVVGNPPWVRNSRIDARSKRMYADRYALFRARGGDGAAFHQPDLSVAFFERALQLTAPGGVTALLMPAKIANAAYAAPLRRAAERNARIVAIDDWSDEARRNRWFEADTFPLGIVLARDERPRGVHVTAAGESFTVAQLSVGNEWALVPPEVGAIARRLRERFPSLEQVLNRRPFMGVKTGDNRNFFLTDEEVRRFRVPASALCRCVRGRDLQRWTVAASHWMLWPPRGGWREVPKWLERFAAARALRPHDFRLSFVRAEHVGIKVAWKDLSRGMAAAVLPDEVNIDEHAYPLVPNQTLYAIDAVTLDEAHAFAALLNSAPAGALLLCSAERAKDGHYRYFGRTVGALPLPDPLPEWDRLARAGRRRNLAEADAAAARLYGLSEGELRLLRAFLERRTGAR